MSDLELLITETGHITERLTSGDTVRPGCLGQLKGPIAEWHDSTRNDRYYSRKLWEGVFNTPWVKEALRTKTLFGEADHPDDRLEPKLMKAAVVLTSYDINETDETVYGTFDILDTPSGRVLRTLSDYGCELGVSSRGRGRIVTRNGRKTVDESSYLFGGFDVVALPAVKKARQSFIKESVTTDLVTSITNQINECSSANDLMVIKNILDSASLDESADFDQLIESKLSELNSDDNTIVLGLTNDLKEAYARIHELESKSSETSVANTISIEEAQDNLSLMHQLLTENQSYVSVITALKSELSAKSELVEKLTESVDSMRTQLKESRSHDKDAKVVTEQVASMTSKLAESAQVNDQLTEQLGAVKSSLDKALSENFKLKATINEMKDANTSLESENHRLTVELDGSISDYNELIDTYNVMVTENSELTNKYLEQQATRLGLNAQALIRLLPENYTVDDIDNTIQSQLAIKRKLNKLPMSQASIGEGAVSEASHVQPKSDVESVELLETRQLLNSMKIKKG